jgi:hypothetical protein
MKGLVVLITLIGIVLLQIYLSKKENKWVGLILPGICLIISILAVIGMIFYTNYSTETITTVDMNARAVNTVIHNTTNKHNMDLASVIFSSIMVFFISNIPTGIFLAIYVSCRGKLRKNLELEKMNIQDLE